MSKLFKEWTYKLDNILNIENESNSNFAYTISL